jgi:hypothetical protein
MRVGIATDVLKPAAHLMMISAVTFATMSGTIKTAMFEIKY